MNRPAPDRPTLQDGVSAIGQGVSLMRDEEIWNWAVRINVMKPLIFGQIWTVSTEAGI